MKTNILVFTDDTPADGSITNPLNPFFSLFKPKYLFSINSDYIYVFNKKENPYGSCPLWVSSLFVKGIYSILNCLFFASLVFHIIPEDGLAH